MSTSLGMLMAQLSQESSQTEQVGAEELLVVTEEATTELEESIEELADEVNDVAVSEAAVEKVLEATVSLENNMALLTQMIEDGKRLSGPSVILWQNGIRESFEAREIPEGVWGVEFDSLTTSFESNVAGDYTTEALEGLKAVATRIWEMLKKAWKWVKEAWTRLRVAVGTSTQKLDKAADALLAAAGKIPAGAKAEKFSAKPYAQLGDTSGNINVVARLKGLVADLELTRGACDATLNSVSAAQSALEAGKVVEGVEHQFKDGQVISGPEGRYKIAAASSRIGFGMKVKVEITSKYKPQTGDATPLSISDIREVAAQLRALSAKCRDLTALLESHKASKKEVSQAINVEDKAKATGLATAIIEAVKVTETISNRRISGSLAIGKRAYMFAVQSVRSYKVEKAEKAK